MCGICGFVDVAGRPADPAVLVRMRDVMTYRGPDDAGIHIDGALALGHRRLSIIDLKSGAQPMSSHDGSSHVVFNGEIYNYLELRRTHAATLAPSHTNSDTEVILQLYEKFGPACVEHFNGMFAFALWDAKARTPF
jgi:asparagine synthase (glutamine-hydrolysing)